MIQDTDTCGTTADKPVRIKPNTTKAKSARAKSATVKPAKAEALAVKMVHDDGPSPVAVVMSVRPVDRDPRDIATTELVGEILTAIGETEGIVATAKETAAAAIEKARRAGDLLCEAKRRCGHGKFRLWIRDNLRGLSWSTVSRYMRLSKQMRHVTHLHAHGNLSAAYRSVGILPEKAKGQGKVGSKSEGKAGAAIGRVRDGDAVAGGPDGPPPSAPLQQSDAVPDDAGHRPTCDPGARLVQCLRDVRSCLVELGDSPDVSVADDDLQDIRETGRRLIEFATARGRTVSVAP